MLSKLICVCQEVPGPSCNRPRCPMSESGHLQPPCAVTTDGSLSPDSCRPGPMPVTAESGHKRTREAEELWCPESASSFRPDPQLLDERPPFLGIGLHQRAERLRCLPLARDNVHAEIGDPRSRRRIGQRSCGRRIELADDVLRRAPGREKPEPGGVGKAWQDHLP